MKECCDMMELGLSRAKSDREPGLMRLGGFGRGGIEQSIVIRVNPCSDESDHSLDAGVSFLVIEYCPFCGKKAR
jgi:hypothetical protein